MRHRLLNTKTVALEVGNVSEILVVLPFAVALGSACTSDSYIFDSENTLLSLKYHLQAYWCAFVNGCYRHFHSALLPCIMLEI